MPDTLSQSQIDALLQEIHSGTMDKKETEEKKKIKVYDFSSPKKFTKEQLRNMESLHENLGRVLSSYFTGVLRMVSEVVVLQVEEQRYYEYNNALPDTALMGMLELTPKDAAIASSTLMMDISPNIAYCMIDRFLGGTGVSHPLQRDFTEIELAIMQAVFEKITGYMTDVWRDYLAVDIQLSSIETNPRLIQLYAPEDIVVIVLMSVRLRDVQGTISITMPGIGVEEMLYRFTSKYTRLSNKFLDENRERISKGLIKHSLYQADLEMKLSFAQTQLGLSDVLNLQVNDVLALDKSVGEDIVVKVDDQPWFTGSLGCIKGNKAVRVTDACMKNWNKEEYWNGE